MTQSPKDAWFEWLKKRRFADDPQNAERALNAFNKVRDRVVDPAHFTGEKTLLDVGCGDGLIAFGALGKNPAGRVIFCDLSQDLLDDCQRIARETGVEERCTFLNASAENLSALPDESVDAVTTRSVLIYVSNKSKAFGEFYRVLRQGGRLSIFEPINRFGYPSPEGNFLGYDIHPVWEIGKKILELYERLQPWDSDPMLDFDERDLLSMAEKSGFKEIDMQFEANVRSSMKRGWNNLIHYVGNPKIPSLEEALEQALTPEERMRFEEHVRPIVEIGAGIFKAASVYLWAEK